MSDTDSMLSQVSEKEGTNDRDEWFSTPDPAVGAPKSLSIKATHPALQKQHDPPHVPDPARLTESNKKQYQRPSPFASDSKRLSANTSLEKPNYVRLNANGIGVNSTFDSRTTAVTHEPATSVQEALPANRSFKQQLTPVAVPITPVDEIAQPSPPSSNTPGQVPAHPTTVETSVPIPVPGKIEPPPPVISNRQAKRLARKAARKEAQKSKATESRRVSDPTSRAVTVISPQPIVTSETDLAQATVKEGSPALRQPVDCLNHLPGLNANPVRSLDPAITADARDSALDLKPGFKSVNVRVRSLSTRPHRG